MVTRKIRPMRFDSFRATASQVRGDFMSCEPRTIIGEAVQIFPKFQFFPAIAAVRYQFVSRHDHNAFELFVAIHRS